MRRAVIVAIATTLALSLVGVAWAFTPGKPEVDRAAARFQGQGQVDSVRCGGEDGDPYIEMNGRWAGPITDTSPVPGDFSLTGTLQLSMKIVMNAPTGTGEALGTATIQGAAGGAKTFNGRITLVTQRTPDLITARGMIIGNALGPNGPTGDRLVANVELDINRTTNALNGSFGGPASIPDLSIKDNNQSCT
jgi:hypothetical protein